MRIHPLLVACLMIGGCGADEPTVEVVQRYFTPPPPPAKLAKLLAGNPNPFGVITRVDGQRLVWRGDPAYRMLVMLTWSHVRDDSGAPKKHCIMVWLVRPAADWVVDSVSWSPIEKLPAVCPQSS